MKTLLLLLSVLLPFGRGDFLNDYFDDKVFGRDPGPCPNEAEKCTLDLNTAEFPPSIGNIEFCLVTIFGFGLFCDSLKDWVQDGEVDVFNLRCEDVGVTSIDLSTLSVTPSTINTRFNVDSARMRCSGRMRLKDVLLAGRASIEVNALTDFQTSRNRRGVDLNFDLSLSNNEIGGLNQNLVNNGDIRNCGFDVDLGLSVSNTRDFQIGLLGATFGITLFDDLVINLVLLVVEAAIGSIFCQIIEQAGRLNNGQQGILNDLLDQLNEQYDIIVAPVDVNPQRDDEALQDNPGDFRTTAEELALSLNLADSNALEFISVTLNDFLGDPTVDPLRINQAIELITEPDGEFFFDLSQSEASLSGTIPIQIADVTLNLESFKVVGLSSISDFLFLGNDFAEGGDGLDFTLVHRFFMDSFQFLFKIDTKFARGDFVTESSCGTFPNFQQSCTSDQETFTFDFGLTVEGIELDAATLTAFDLNRLQETQIGQILDKELTDFLQVAKEILACVAPAIFVAQFSDLSLTVQSIGDAVIENFSGQGVDDLVRNSVDIFSVLTKNLIANDLEHIVRGPVRTEINRFLLAEVADVSSFDNCAPYVQVPSADPHIRFSEPPINGIFPVINSILGNFEADSDVDLNDFIQELGEHYAANAEDFPLEPGAELGDWVTKQENIPLVDFAAFEEAFTDASSAFIQVSDTRILNLNTINKFNSEEASDVKPHGFSFEIGFVDEEASALQIAIGFSIFAPALGNNEKFDFIIEVQGVDFNIFVDELLVNEDSIFRLTFRQLSHIPCVQSVLDGFDADIDRSSAAASNIRFDIVFDESVQSTSDLRNALNLLDAEFTESNGRFTALTNFLFEVGFKTGLAELEQSDFSLTPEECNDVRSDISFLLSLFIGFSTLEATFLQDECLQPPAVIPSPELIELDRLGTDTDKFFNLKESLIIELIADFLDVSSGNAEDEGTIQNLLFTLANAENNFISDFLIVEQEEDGDEFVTFELPLNEPNFILDILQLQPFSIADANGFLAEAQVLKIKRIDQFMNNLDLFQTPSNFTLRHSIGFTEESALKIEMVFLLEVSAEIVDGAPPGTPPISETINVEIDLNGMRLDLQMLTAIEEEPLKNLSVGHFVSIDENQVFGIADTAIDCLLSSTEAGFVEITELNVDFASIGTPIVNAEANQLVSPGVEAVTAEVVKLLGEFYADGLPRITQNCLREQANIALVERILLADGVCPVTPSFTQLSEANSIFKFSDSGTYRIFQDFLTDVFYPNNFEVLNLFIEGITNEKFFDTNPLSTGVIELSYDGVEYGGLEINFTGLEIDGLNTMTAFQLLEPKSRDDPNFDEEVDPFITILAFNHTGPTTYDTTEIITGYDIFVQADVVSNDIDLNFIFTNFSFRLEMILKIDLNTVLNMQFNQVDEFNEIPCLITPVRDLDVIDFEIQVDDIEVTFDCNSVCDSPLLERLAFNGPFSSANSEELADVFQTGIAFVVSYLESSPAQTLIDVAITNSEDNCDSFIEEIDNLFQGSGPDDDVFFYLFYVCLFVIFVLGASMFIQYPRHKRLLGLRINEFQQGTDKEFNMSDELDIFANEMRALAWSPVVPTVTRIFVPILCFFNMILLTWAVTSQGALTVLLTFTILEMEMVAIDLVPFTVVSTVDDLWNSGGWYLSIMIVGFSFLWPIVKNMALLYLWYTPTTVLKPDSRAIWLEFLDVMGKWSFVDVFVVVMTLSALQTSISLSQQDSLTFLDEDFFNVFVTMKPEVGIVMLSVVSALSLIANHIMTYYNRKTDAFYKSEYDRISGNTITPKRATQKKNMKKYKFAGRKTSEGRMKILVYLNLVSGLLTIIGVFLPLVSFELRGVVGLLVEAIDATQASREFSVFGLGALLFEAGPEGFDEQIVIALFVFLYFAVAVFGPFFQIIVIHVILTKKFNLANLNTMIYVVMLVSFWTALDVVLIGVAATLLQITNVTEFIVNFITNDICANIEGVLASFVPDEQDDSCLSVVGFFEIGAIPLLFGTIGQLAVHAITMVMATRMKQDWYYFAYVLHGHRKRESKPKKLTYARLKVYNFFTVPTNSREDPEENVKEEPRGTKKESLTAGNPRFMSSPSTEASRYGQQQRLYNISPLTAEPVTNSAVYQASSAVTSNKPFPVSANTGHTQSMYSAQSQNRTPNNATPGFNALSSGSYSRNQQRQHNNYAHTNNSRTGPRPTNFDDFDLDVDV